MGRNENNFDFSTALSRVRSAAVHGPMFSGCSLLPARAKEKARSSQGPRLPPKIASVTDS
ncbi:hypothetical protein B1812_15885 [Methylocystis bryophila]|uniref:Uncharacterized protein n=1 Tax=Methylocystis bryophila TaxID=655015 RepID=A0A1W6MXM0_9HYPH|nr:hypothetical protein B1812_15885 [Methylocystis bryophila]